MCTEESTPSKTNVIFSFFITTNLCRFSIISFLVSAEIQREIDSKMEPTSKGWGCRVCGFDSNNKTRTWEHVEAKHVDTGGYNCSVCSKFCKSTSSLRNHMDRYHKEMKKMTHLELDQPFY